MLIKKVPHKKVRKKIQSTHRKLYFVGYFFLFFAHVSILPPPPTFLANVSNWSPPPTHLFADAILEWSLTHTAFLQRNIWFKIQAGNFMTEKKVRKVVSSVHWALFCDIWSSLWNVNRKGENKLSQWVQKIKCYHFGIRNDLVVSYGRLPKFNVWLLFS